MISNQSLKQNYSKNETHLNKHWLWPSMKWPLSQDDKTSDYIMLEFPPPLFFFFRSDSDVIPDREQYRGTWCPFFNLYVYYLYIQIYRYLPSGGPMYLGSTPIAICRRALDRSFTTDSRVSSDDKDLSSSSLKSNIQTSTYTCTCYHCGNKVYKICTS